MTCRRPGMVTENDEDEFMAKFASLLFGKLQPEMMERGKHPQCTEGVSHTLGIDPVGCRCFKIHLAQSPHLTFDYFATHRLARAATQT